MFIIGIILGSAVIVFLLQNIVPVSVSFLAWQFDGSLAIIVILAVVIGMIISWLLAIPDMLRLSDLKSHNKRLQKDLDIHRQKLSETEGKLSQVKEPVVVERTVIVENE
jgi:lipopolysaccharide assembly protein A